MGPWFFTLYTNPLGKIIRSHNIHFHSYADGTQLYVFFDPRLPGDVDRALAELISCISDIRVWVQCNKLKLNHEKTEFFVTVPRHLLHQFSNIPITMELHDQCISEYAD